MMRKLRSISQSMLRNARYVYVYTDPYTYVCILCVPIRMQVYRHTHPSDINAYISMFVLPPTDHVVRRLIITT